MRSPENNPFLPGSDVVPTVWAGRADEVATWPAKVRTRRVLGQYERGRVILGEPGVGKSTLVRRLAQLAAEQGDWVTPQLRIPVGADPMKSVASAVLILAERAGLATTRERRISAMLNRVRELEVAGMALSIDRRDGPEPHVALADLLIEVGRAAFERKAVVFLHIDEVQNITDDRTLSQLLVALGDVLGFEFDVEAPGGQMITRYLPVVVYLTGLPEFEDNADTRQGATFSRRFAWQRLDPLDDADIVAALDEFVTTGWEVVDGDGGTGTVTMAQDAVDAIIRACCGDPFLFQLAGERAWDASASSLITVDDVGAGWSTAIQEAERHVDRILDRLPDRERQFIDIMAGLAPDDRTLTRIATDLGYGSAAQIATTARRLDSVRGLIQRGGGRGRPCRFRHRAVEAYLTSEWPELLERDVSAP